MKSIKEIQAEIKETYTQAETDAIKEAAGDVAKKVAKTTAWRMAKNKVVNTLKNWFIEWAIKRILGWKSLAGFQLWLAKFVVEELFDQVGKPIVLYAIRKGKLFYDIRDGSIKVGKLEDAIKEKDEDTYDDIVDDA